MLLASAGCSWPWERYTPTESAPPRSCSWRDSFTLSAPTPLDGVNTQHNEAEPFLSNDRLTLFFFSTRDSADSVSDQQGDSYVATRSSANGRFGSVRRQPWSSQLYREAQLALTADGDTAFLSANWQGTRGAMDIWMATGAADGVGLEVGDFVNLASINSTTSEHDPFPSLDGMRLYFALWSKPNALQLFYAERADPSGAFGPPRALDELNTNSGEASPSITADELLIVFTSSRRTFNGEPQNDLFYAWRESVQDRFSPPLLVPQVNTEDENESDAFITPDGCELYYVKAAPQGGDIYRATYRSTRSAP